MTDENAERPTVEGAELEWKRLYNCGCVVQGEAFTSCGRHDAPPTELTEALAREALGIPPIECPGCYQVINAPTLGGTLAATYAHELFCAPPGFIDLLLWHSDPPKITTTLARWVGNSMARMIGAPPTVGRPDLDAAAGSPQGDSGP